VAVTAVELLPEMYHFLASGRINPVVSDGKPIVTRQVSSSTAAAG
jgi:hypothetical protein